MDIQTNANSDADRYVFISLPMRGSTIEQIRKRMERIFKPFKKSGYKLINTVWLEPEPDDLRHHTYYLGKSISEMCRADVVVFASDWAKASGCRIERMICNTYDIPKIEEEALAYVDHVNFN